MIYGKTEKRIAQYLTYLDKTKYSDLEDVYGLSGTIASWEYSITDRMFRTPPESSDLEWKKIPAFPFSWGRDNETWWFRSSLTLPDGPESEKVFLEAAPGTDTLAFFNGIPLGAVNPFHEKIRIDRNDFPEQPIRIALEAWAGHTFPGYHPDDGPRVLTTVAHRQASYPLTFLPPRLLIRNEDVYGLYYDVKVLYETAVLQAEGSLLRSRITDCLHKALLHLDFTADRKTRRTQAAAVREEIRPLLNLKNGSLAPRIYSIGNAHLDHAWLWPLSETSRKCARTCANMAAYAEEYPEFRYLHSQPVQLLELKENYPEIFRRVKRAVDRGQWEPNGGMWVEADCNLAGGESLIRQFLLGHQTNQELFGYKGDVLWLPDVFGYTAALPQIMKGCGIDYFITSKISWNDTTRFPFDLFLWEGLDGTQIPTHFITTAYEGRNTPHEAAEAWSRVQHKELQFSLLRSIGEGDGGGGTMRADLECMRRMEDLQGIPRNGWNNLSDSMKRVFSETGDLPIYRGELYLELHRGTYTTQGQIKRYNRKLEYMLRELELKEVRLLLSEDKQANREASELGRTIKDAWKELLTLQFHDILPGTSIRRVNEEALETYRLIKQRLKEAFSKADAFLCGIEYSVECVLYGVSNSLPVSRTSVFGLSKKVETPEWLPSQDVLGIDGNTRLIALAYAEGLTMGTVRLPADFPERPFCQKDNNLETPWYTVTFDKLGSISALTMKESGRTVQARSGLLNSFILTEDLPVSWDAWDIEDDYRFKEQRETRLISRKTVSSGRICHQIRQELAIGENSHLVQNIFFYAHTPRIDFQTRVEWREDHKLLRVCFPTSVTTGKGYFDIPFGYAERETHRNRPENRAQFEVCAHKWACVRDARLSTALLSDCKYGYRVDGGNLSLTLLRSPSAPDPLADRGLHEFTYAFFPSENTDLRQVMREGWDLNIPLRPLYGELKGTAEEPLFRLSTQDLMIESVKVSEDRRGVVVRVWETTGAPLDAMMTPGTETGLTRAALTDMLENPLEDFYEAAKGISLSFRGFEVKTILFITD